MNDFMQVYFCLSLIVTSLVKHNGIVDLVWNLIWELH